jgi:antitoxin YefM
MNAVSYVDAQSNLAKMIDQVCDRHDPVIGIRCSSDSLPLLNLKSPDAATVQSWLEQLTRKK